MISKAVFLAMIVTPGLAFAQAGQTPPTDPQSKRQQENPSVTGPATTDSTSTINDGAKATTPPIADTAPVGADPKVANDKKGPLQSAH